MIVLALETSGQGGGVAVQRDAGPLVQRDLSGPRRHSPELLMLVEQSLREIGARLRDVSVIAWSRGPGSFTGLRIGATIARIAAQVAGARVIGVCSLEACALNAAESWAGDLRDPAHGSTRVAVLVDAKRQHVYGATYVLHRTSEPTLTPRQPPALCLPGTLLASLEPPFGIVGEGIAAHESECSAGPGRVAPPEWRAPRATAVLALARARIAAGQFDTLESVVPLYIRPPECEEFYEIRRAAAIEKRAARSGDAARGGSS